MRSRCSHLVAASVEGGRRLATDPGSQVRAQILSLRCFVFGAPAAPDLARRLTRPVIYATLAAAAVQLIGARDLAWCQRYPPARLTHAGSHSQRAQCLDAALRAGRCSRRRKVATARGTSPLALVSEFSTPHPLQPARSRQAATRQARAARPQG